MQCYTFFGCSGLEPWLVLQQAGERGGGAGSSYELDAARSIQSMFLFLILDLLGGFSLKAIQPSISSFIIFEVKKDTYDDISARKVLKTKQLLDNRLGLHIFSKFRSSGPLCNISLSDRKFFLCPSRQG